MMKIAFLQETFNQNIGIMYLSALLKANRHNCELFVEHLQGKFIDSVISYKPDILGFSVITGAHHWALRMADYFRKELPETTIILGGPHPTYFPEVLNNKAVDIVARGEAEISFIEFVKRKEKQEDYADIAGLWVKKDNKIYRNELAKLVENLSSLPFPDHDLYLKYNFYRQQSEVPFSATRGCPFRCSFCYNNSKAVLYQGKGKYVRTREVDEVIKEMELARKIYPKMRSIILSDDIIGIDKKWLADFSDAYSKHINLPWFTSIRADCIDDFVAEHLAKANCFCLSLGVETGDEELREKVLGKKIPNSQYIKASELLHKAGIKVRTSNMLFLPGEDIHKALKTVDLNRQMKVDFAWAYTLQPYPGTAIYDYAIKTGYLSSAFQFDDIDPLGLLKPIIRVKDKDKNKMLVLHRMFFFAVQNTVIRRLLKTLILFPPNPVFDLIYSFSLILSYAKYHQVSRLRAISVAWNNYWGTRNNFKRQISLSV